MYVDEVGNADLLLSSDDPNHRFPSLTGVVIELGHVEESVYPQVEALKAITVCLDKKAHRERHATWQYDPYHYHLAVLVERFVYFLDRRRAHGDVIAESRGGKEDRRLKESFRRLCEKGSDYVSAEQMQEALASREIKMKQKANNIGGLHLADLDAHPSRNEILRENGHAVTIAPFATRVITVLQSKYDRRGSKTFGKKML